MRGASMGGVWIQLGSLLMLGTKNSPELSYQVLSFFVGLLVEEEGPPFLSVNAEETAGGFYCSAAGLKLGR